MRRGRFPEFQIAYPSGPVLPLPRTCRCHPPCHLRRQYLETNGHFDVWGRLFSWLQLNNTRASLVLDGLLRTLHQVQGPSLWPLLLQNEPACWSPHGIVSSNRNCWVFLTTIMELHGFSFNMERSMWKGNIWFGKRGCHQETCVNLSLRVPRSKARSARTSLSCGRKCVYKQPLEGKIPQPHQFLRVGLAVFLDSLGPLPWQHSWKIFNGSHLRL